MILQFLVVRSMLSKGYNSRKALLTDVAVAVCDGPLNNLNSSGIKSSLCLNFLKVMALR